MFPNKNNILSLKYGAPGTIRTSDPQIRSLMLYPAELRARTGLYGEGGYLAARLRGRNPVFEPFANPVLGEADGRA